MKTKRELDVKYTIMTPEKQKLKKKTLMPFLWGTNNRGDKITMFVAEYYYQIIYCLSFTDCTFDSKY